MTDPKKTRWNKKRDDVLTSMIESGHDIKKVAFSLGCSVEAVEIRARKLGVLKSKNPIVTDSRTTPQNPKSNRKKALEDDYETPVSGLKSMAELGARDCCFPIGDPKKEGFGFCGKRRESHRVYCDEHKKVAYRGVTSYDDFMIKPIKRK